MLDVHLYDETLCFNLGMIQTQEAVKQNENMSKVRTPLGIFVVEDGVVIRGKLDGRSIHGHNVSMKELMGD